MKSGAVDETRLLLNLFSYVIVISHENCLEVVGECGSE